MIRDWSVHKEYKKEQKKKKRKIYLTILAVLVMGGAYFFLAPFFFRPTGKVEVGNEEVKEQKAPRQVSNEGKRKKIYDRDMRELAVSFKLSSVYVKPLEFDNIEKTVSLLAEVLGLDEKSLLEELKAQRSFKWLAENIQEEKVREIADLSLSGVYFYEQHSRFYPEGARVANIIGEVKDEQGLSGIEAYYDSFLRYDAVKKSDSEGEIDKGLVLTLDMEIQGLLAKQMGNLHKVIETDDNGFVFGDQTVINALVMDVTSGEILAYVQYPSAGHGGLGVKGENAGRESLLTMPVDPGRLSLLFKVADAYNRGEAVISGEEDLPGEVKWIYPRHLKKIVKKQKLVQWVEAGEGSYTSPWLAHALPAMDEEALDEQSKDFSVQDFIDQGVSCSVDLPGKNGGGDTGLGLLCGITALVNGGKSVKPHFLKGFYTEDNKLEERKWPAQEKKIVEPEASRKFVRFLQEAVGGTSSVMVGEVIVPLGTGLFQEEENPENQGAQDEEKANQVMDNCRVIVLAAAPVKNPELAMVLNVEHGRVDLENPSPFKAKSEEFLKKAIRLHRQKSSSRTKHKYTVEDYRNWLFEREQLPGSGKNIKKANGRMQDVRGLSLRKALQILEQNDVKVMIEGSGRVKSQYPAPGSKLAKDTVVVLKAEVVK
ncbi:MAG: PASTA domain-containing protein [Desulfobulbaceae bacterium]|nr:PASTA domain-containing protein [Desulfobulbaceae bacterium]